MFKDNFDLFSLFCDKIITIYDDNNNMIELNSPTLFDLYHIKALNSFIELSSKSVSAMKNNLSYWQDKINTPFDYIKLLLFEVGRYIEFQPLKQTILESFNFFFQNNYTLENQQLIINNVIIDDSWWDYILYVIALTKGEQKSKPIIYKDEIERKFYQQQQENEEKIKNIRDKAKNNNSSNDNNDTMLKLFLQITYAFPQFSFDFLFKQTITQIKWLQKYAAKALNYDIESQAYAAGNLKKLKFFIDEK